MSMTDHSKLLQEERFSEAAAAWAANKPQETAKQLHWMRDGMRILTALSRVAGKITEDYVASSELLAALELSLLRKTDPKAYQRVRSLMLAFASASGRSTPIALATQTLTDFDSTAHERISRAIRHHELWQLAKLFRYPLFGSNGEYFRSWLAALLADPDGVAGLTPKARFKTAILASAMADETVFQTYTKAAAKLEVPEDCPAPVARALTSLKRHAEPAPRSPIVAKARPRIALCLSGQMRGYQTAATTLQHLGLDDCETEIFVHTWKRLGRAWPDPEIIGTVERLFASEAFCRAYRQQASETGFDTVMRLYPTLFEFIETSSNVTEEEIKEQYGPQTQVMIDDESSSRFAGFSNQQKMHYKIHAAHELMRTSGHSFDLVIRLRPDRPVADRTSIDWQKVQTDLQNRPTVFAEEGFALRENYVVGDQFAVSDMEGMTAYAGTWLKQQNAAATPVYGVPKAFTGHTSIAYNLFHEGYAGRKMPGLVLKPLSDAEKIGNAQLRGLLMQDIATREMTTTDTILLATLDQEISPQ
ncbi:hypothetical protein [Phaeobacter inhibens]|uniref:hypothetical protein n=1 Tax=Phaeobacter inhibens TaxID=221822 RepID=UPI000C9C2103|nr:hypothetical protein [Phaeobacter inhibens]AUQ68761.1 hypothetical protein PhaeoP78_03945 [Phaeobacter inhibens]